MTRWRERESERKRERARERESVRERKQTNTQTGGCINLRLFWAGKRGSRKGLPRRDWLSFDTEPFDY